MVTYVMLWFRVLNHNMWFRTRASVVHYLCNDLLSLSINYKSILFADDTVISFKEGDITELVTVVNYELDKFKTWTIANRLTVNKDKTVFNIISNININRQDIIIVFDNEVLNYVSNVKYLGVFLDDRLKFKEHIRYVGSKVSKAVGILNRLKSQLPFFTMRTLYHTLVHPYFNYCNLIWGGTYRSHLHPLIIIQKRIIRIIFNRPYLDHTNPLFFDGKILKIEDLYKYNLGKFMFLNQNDPIYQNNNAYDLRSQDLLVPQFERLTTTQHSVHFQGPHLWNQLPIELGNSNSLNIFVRYLKEYFLNEYQV